MYKSKIIQLIGLLLFLVLSAGCSLTANFKDDELKPITVTAVGLGVIPTKSTYSKEQAHLLAVKASRIDAYRSLVEKIYGVEVSSKTTVRSLAVENDSFKAKVEGMIQMAKVDEVLPVMEGKAYQTTMSVVLTPEFRSYVLKGIN